MQNNIHYYCGPDAIVRPYTHHVCSSSLLHNLTIPNHSTRDTHTFQNQQPADQVEHRKQGRDGFLVTTVGPALTHVSRVSSVS